MMHGFRRIFAFIIGAVFVFSGAAKLMDPVGTGFIVSSYMEWMHLPFLDFAAKAVGTLLALIEAVVGVALMTGVWRRAMALISSLLIASFTFITLLLVLTNPDMDCGCFGEFIHLTHFQTFLKNLVLCFLACVAFIPYWDLGITPARKYLAFFINSAAMLCLAVYSWTNIPYFDYTSYRPSYTIMPESAMVESETTVSLAVWDSQGEDMSELITDDYVALISVYDVEKLDDKDRGAIARFAASAWNSGFVPYVLATSELEIPGVETFFADRKSLMTLNRSNGGITLVEDGYICTKHHASQPYTEETMDDILVSGADDFYVRESTRKAIGFQLAGAIFLLIALI